MLEYKITRQAVDTEWAVVPGTAAREVELHPPAGDDWTLHSFEHAPEQVVAVWQRPKRPHPMSEIYATTDKAGTASGAPRPVKTASDMPEPK